MIKLKLISSNLNHPSIPTLKNKNKMMKQSPIDHLMCQTHIPCFLFQQILQNQSLFIYPCVILSIILICTQMMQRQFLNQHTKAIQTYPTNTFQFKSNLDVHP